MSEFEPTLRELLASGHAARFRASGDSMYPTIRDGDYLHIVPCDAAQLRRGDVVLATTERGLTAHRVLRVGASAIATRGDNALRADRPVALADVLGRVEQIERGEEIRTTDEKSATITRFAAVLVRRLRSRFHF